MKLLLFYLSRTFVNSIKKILKTWLGIAVIGLIAIFIVGGLAGVVASKVFDDSLEESGTANGNEIHEEIEAESDEELLGLFDEARYIEIDGRTIIFPENIDEITREDKAFFLSYIACVVFLIVLSMVLFQIYTANKKGSDIFLMADIHFLCTAPLSPQTVLMFRTIMQMGVILVGSIYLVFQIPNLVLNLKMSMGSIIFLFGILILATIITKLLNIFVYCIVATKQHLRKWVTPVVIGIFAITILGWMLSYFYFGLVKGESIFLLPSSMIEKNLFVFFPIVGWFFEAVFHFYMGNMLQAILYILIIIICAAVIVWLIWNFKADFYEDTLEQVQRKQDLLEEIAKTGQAKKKRSTKNTSKQSFMLENINRWKEGAKVLYSKQMHERRRNAYLGFITKSMISKLVVLAAIAYLITRIEYQSGLNIVGIWVLGGIFLRGYQNSFTSELQKNYIYLIPCAGKEKIFYCIVSEITEQMLDLIPGFLVAAYISSAGFGNVFGWILLFISFIAILLSAGCFIELIIPSNLNETIRTMIMLFFKFIGAFPLLLVVIILAVANLMHIAVMVGILVNTGIGAITFFLAAHELEKGMN